MDVADGGEGGELSPGEVALYAGGGLVVDPSRGAHLSAALGAGAVTGRAHERVRRGIGASEVLPLAKASLAGAGLEIGLAAAKSSRQAHVVVVLGLVCVVPMLIEERTQALGFMGRAAPKELIS